jgi:hypothetical protein
MLLATWPAKINQLHTLDPEGAAVDPAIFEMKTENVQVTPTKNYRNQSHFIATADTLFTNPFSFSMQSMNIQLQTTIYYKNVPIVHVSTFPTQMLGIQTGRNKLRLKMVTVPEYNAELMTLISRVADGIETRIVISDFKILGDPKWQWIQDMVDGWSIPYTIPKIEDFPMNTIF